MRSPRRFRAAVEAMERRDTQSVVVPTMVANAPRIRYTIFGGTAADRQLVTQTIAAMTTGLGLNLRPIVVHNNARADYVIDIGTCIGGPYSSGTLKRPPGGFGTAVSAVPPGIAASPVGWDTFAHEFGHILGLGHPGWARSSPPITTAESEAIAGIAGANGWSEAQTQYQFGYHDYDVVDTGYDPDSIMEINPLRGRPHVGPGPHLSAGDVATLQGLYPARVARHAGRR